MNFGSKDLANYAGYRNVEAFQVDQRRYDWPLMPIRRIRGKNRYAFAECIVAHVIWRLRCMNVGGSSINLLLSRIDLNALHLKIDEFDAGIVDDLILTIPCVDGFEPDGGCELLTVHTKLETAQQTLSEVDCIFIQLTDMAVSIREGHV